MRQQIFYTCPPFGSVGADNDACTGKHIPLGRDGQNAYAAVRTHERLKSMGCENIPHTAVYRTTVLAALVGQKNKVAINAARTQQAKLFCKAFRRFTADLSTWANDDRHVARYAVLPQLLLGNKGLFGFSEPQQFYHAHRRIDLTGAHSGYRCAGRDHCAELGGAYRQHMLRTGVCIIWGHTYAHGKAHFHPFSCLQRDLSRGGNKRCRQMPRAAASVGLEAHFSVGRKAQPNLGLSASR